MAKLKCSKCDRTFSMPAHLARHMGTIHATSAQKAARKTAKRKVRRGPGRPVGRPAGSTRVSAAASDPSARRVISEMRAYHGALVSQRSSLETQISSIENALMSMGAIGAGAPSGARRGRPPGKRKAGRKGGVAGRKPGRPVARASRDGSLKDTIVKVLKQRKRAMAPREIAAAVRSTGYTSKAKDLTKAVSNALLGLKTVTKQGRGLYRA